MDIYFFDSELKVMDVIWREGDTHAKEIARQLTNELGWNVNTCLFNTSPRQRDS